MAATRKSGGGSEVTVLRMKVQELEKQVADYKARLDSLRKAKNTTVVKREREVVEVGAPQFGKRAPVPVHQPQPLQKKDSLVEQVQKELDASNKRHAEEMQALKQKHSEEKISQSCNHEPEIRRLKEQVSSLEADKAALVLENEDLRDRVQSLVHELSVKEASWCETEEQLNLKLKMQWGEKYKEWMAETERRIEELTQANALLRKMIKKPEDEQGTSGRKN